MHIVFFYSCFYTWIASCIYSPGVIYARHSHRNCGCVLNSVLASVCSLLSCACFSNYCSSSVILYTLATPALTSSYLSKHLEWKKQNHIKHSRSIFVASVEDHERVRLAKEVLLVQLVGTELHSGAILQGCMEMWGEKCEIGCGGGKGRVYHKVFMIIEWQVLFMWPISLFFLCFFSFIFSAYSRAADGESYLCITL